MLVGVLTGWPAGGLLAALAVFGLPALLGPDRQHQRALARVEAVAGWAELLRDTLAAAARVQQTIIATAATAPEPIRPQVRELADGLRHGFGLQAGFAALRATVGRPERRPGGRRVAAGR